MRKADDFCCDWRIKGKNNYTVFFFQNISGIHQVIGNIFLIFPNYCLGNGLMEIALNYYKNEFYSHTGI